MHLATVKVRNKKTGQIVKVNEADWGVNLASGQWVDWERVGAERKGDTDTPLDVKEEKKEEEATVEEATEEATVEEVTEEATAEEKGPAAEAVEKTKAPESKEEEKSKRSTRRRRN